MSISTTATSGSSSRSVESEEAEEAEEADLGVIGVMASLGSASGCKGQGSGARVSGPGGEECRAGQRWAVGRLVGRRGAGQWWAIGRLGGDDCLAAGVGCMAADMWWQLTIDGRAEPEAATAHGQGVPSGGQHATAARVSGVG